MGADAKPFEDARPAEARPAGLPSRVPGGAMTPTTAALLSFFLPGLAHLRLGARARGILLLAPTAIAVGVAVLTGLGGPLAVLDALLRREVLLGILVLDALLVVSRLAAIVDAYGLAERRAITGIPRRPLSLALVAALLVGTLAVHGAVGAVDYAAYTTVTAVFGGPGSGGDWSIPSPSATESPVPTPTPTTAPSSTGQPRPVPTSTPTPEWASDWRLNLLLIGSDAGPGRWSLRTDTMIVLSVDVLTHRAALFGFPRNLIGVPLPPESEAAFPGGRYPGLLNSLYVYAMGHPDQFPGGDARGFRAVSGAIQELSGVALDGAVVVDLNGFVRLVNAIGGLWIDVPERVLDDHYPLEDGSGYIAIDIEPGCHHFGGHRALIYARSRHQDDDYHRMRRQQAVLVAVARQVDPLGLLPEVPELLDIARDDLWMTVRPEEIRGLASLAAFVDAEKVRTIQFSPPEYLEFLTTPEIKNIRHVVRSVFEEWTDPSRRSTASGSEPCPRSGGETGPTPAFETD